MKKRVAVFGMGYVGCVTAACLSRDRHRVIGVDIDPDKVAEINEGLVPIVEPGLAEIVAAQVRSGQLSATINVEQAVGESDVALISVGTPSADDGSVCCKGLERVIQSIGGALRGGSRPYTIVIRSTVMPGILEERLAPQLEKASGRALGKDLGICNNPEFLRESHAIGDYDHPPFVLVGASDPAVAAVVFELYDGIEAEHILTDTRTSALVKYSCNAFHALKVAFGNEIGSVAREMGADGQKVMSILCRDTKLNISPAYLRPGFAFGGSCLPKDLRALTRYVEEHSLRMELLRSILASNDAHIRRAVRAVERSGQRNIGLVGLSFKAGTDDLRESPLVVLAESLLGKGYNIRIYDPGVQVTRLRGRNLAYVDRHLPHLAALLMETPPEVYEHSSLLILGNDVADEIGWKEQFRGEVLDVRRDLVCTRGSNEINASAEFASL